MEMKIPLEQAREEVRARLFGTACAMPTQEQWNTIFLLQNAERVPRQMQKKLQRALLVREQLDRELFEADKWLRTHVENYDVVTVHSTNAQGFIGGWEAGIEPILIDSDALQNALQREFGEGSDRPLSAPDIGRILGQYLKETNKRPNQNAAIEYLKANAQGRPYSRDRAKALYKNLSPHPVKRGRPGSA
jgi:hypothetical protein